MERKDSPGCPSAWLRDIAERVKSVSLKLASIQTPVSAIRLITGLLIGPADHLLTELQDVAGNASVWRTHDGAFEIEVGPIDGGLAAR